MVEHRNIVEDDMLDTSTKDTSSHSAVDLHPHTVIRDKFAGEDLRVISWPDKSPSPSLTDLKSYSYREEGRGRSFIYVIENGIDPRAPVRSPSPVICTQMYAYLSDR